MWISINKQTLYSPVYVTVSHHRINELDVSAAFPVIQGFNQVKFAAFLPRQEMLQLCFQKGSCKNLISSLDNFLGKLLLDNFKLLQNANYKDLLRFLMSSHVRIIGCLTL